MDIILKKDVESLGSKNDTVRVRDGYANNCLIPNGLATVATSSARKIAAENIRQSAHKEAKFRTDATIIAEQLAAITLEYIVKTKGNKISGSITSSNVSEDLAAKGFSFEKKNIVLQKISSLGTYEASIKLFKEIKGLIKVVVKGEGQEEEVAEVAEKAVAE
ncbi:MAG: 50S ribosomal protein L9 [Bacteroidetes bacterium]|nr:50S ribosomal protein L9 [Bacteroidota bacterium]